MINRFIFSQVNLDSGSLTVLASVVHKFSESGEYYGEVLRGRDVVGRFSILVGDCPTTSTLSSATMQPSVKIDLKALDLPFSQQLENQACSCFMLKPEGYALFFVSTGAGGYVVNIQRPGTKRDEAKVFDSRRLDEEDMFVATVLRPGTYLITNVSTKAKAELVVTYPEIGKTRRHSETVPLECTENAITPDKIRIDPAQGLVFRFKTPSRIKIELVKPEDRPKQAPPEKQIEQTKTQPTVGTPTKKALRRLRINP